MIRLLAIGDLMLGDSAASPGFGFASRFGASGLAQPLSKVQPLFNSADIVFGNLEAVLSRVGVRKSSLSTLHMRAHPRFAEDLRAAGFTVLNLANNHALQHGEAAFDDTRRLLLAAGVTCCGLRGVPPWESDPAIVTCSDGSRIGVLGYCLRPRQYHADELPPFAEGTEAAILGDVRRLVPEVSTVAVSLHWGEEFVSLPSQDEVRFAHTLVEAGAALVLGHHPHVLRPLEAHGNGVIAYSLGNFIGDQTWHPDLCQSGILDCQLEHAKITEATFRRTRLVDTLTVDVSPGKEPIPQTSPQALSESAYRVESDRRLRIMRRAKYRFAIRNLVRGHPRLLLQLGLATIKNRLKQVTRRSVTPTPVPRSSGSSEG